MNVNPICQVLEGLALWLTKPGDKRSREHHITRTALQLRSLQQEGATGERRHCFWSISGLGCKAKSPAFP